MNSKIATILSVAMAIVSLTLAVSNPHGIGNARISFHRFSVGACHWDGSASFGGTWLTDPLYYGDIVYDDGSDWEGEPNP